MSCFFPGGRRRAASLVYRAILLWIPAALAASGCHKPADSTQDSTGGISVQESIAPQPVRTGQESVSIALKDAAGNPLTRAHIQVEGDMDHPGMAPVFSDASETAPGSYEAQINFNMGGDWAVLLHIKLADGRAVERQLNVRGVESR
jgi:hypothetical protein